jgi:hypothetical protein
MSTCFLLCVISVFYLLKLLRDQGMPLKLLHNVYVAIIVTVLESLIVCLRGVDF